MLLAQRSRHSVAMMIVASCTIAAMAVAPSSGQAQSPTERGELAWKAGTVHALQGNADSALAAFASARAIAESVHDSSLLAASLRGAAEVLGAYRTCGDSALALLRQARQVSIAGDRTAGQVLVRRLALAGKIAEARTIHAALYSDLGGEVPRSITRESVSYLSGLAAVQRAAGQHAAALASLRSAREIADRLANGDVVDSLPKSLGTSINSQNYWVTFELAQLMLTSKTRGVASPTEGKALMDALASTDDEPEEGNEHRFSVFRLADRLTVKAWRCQMQGEKCAVPPPRKCS